MSANIRIGSIAPLSRCPRYDRFAAYSVPTGRFHARQCKTAKLAAQTENVGSGALAVCDDDFLHPQAHALEFHRRRIEILHAQNNRHIGRSLHFRRLKAMVLDGHADGGRFLPMRLWVGSYQRAREQKHYRPEAEVEHER